MLRQKWFVLTACFVSIAVSSCQAKAEENPQRVFTSYLASIISEGRHCRVSDSSQSTSQNRWLQSLYDKDLSALLWVDQQRYDALLGALADLKWDGLDPAIYGLSQLEKWRFTDELDKKTLACRDLLASTAYLAALYHLQYGFVDRAQIAPIWRLIDNESSAKAMSDENLGEVARQGLQNIITSFDEARPKSFAYRQLRSAYITWHVLHGDITWPVIPDGPLLKPGLSDNRIPLLRQRLTTKINDIEQQNNRHADEEDIYNSELVEMVKDFQARHHLEIDGVVGPETLAALNQSRLFREQQLQINLERLRWQERDRSPTLLLVDIAGAEAVYTRDGEIIWQGKVQVGTAHRPTPVLRSLVSYLTFSPSWTVPPTIYRQDKLPEIRRDITYLAENRLRVLDQEGRELNPATINWANPGSIKLRQDPGPNNALGQVVIRFANPFFVYLHDTPNQHLFASHRRTYSSGCVRVEGAKQLADALFSGATEETQKAILKSIESRQTRNIPLPVSVPILMDYWTATVGEDGRLAFRPDVYQRDEVLIEAMKAQQKRILTDLFTELSPEDYLED